MGTARALLALTLVVTVPATLALLPGTTRRMIVAVTVLAVPAAGSLALPVGAAAGALSVPWLLAAVWSSISDLLRLPRMLAARSRSPDLLSVLLDVAPVVARGYWAVGAVWLLLHRVGLDPVGVGDGLVLLTAVHFHVAGLVATTVVWVTARTAGARVLPALAGTVAAPPVVALGFAAVPAMQVVGAVIFAAALLWWGATAGPLPGRARWMWLVARGSVWLSMPLATWWAVGYVTGWSAPSIPAMVSTHGAANAVGFALLGVVALHIAGGGHDSESDRVVMSRV